MPAPKKTAKDFDSTSPSENPKILHVSFAKDPSASLGAKILPCDKGMHSFVPGYAIIGKVFNDGMAILSGVEVGDILVAVNGKGFRRFAPDYAAEEAEELTPEIKVDLDHRVMPADEDPYDKLLQTIKWHKAESTYETPLILTLERYTWDARPHAWGRFLEARNQNVAEAMAMWQKHQQWKVSTFPISLVTPGLQRILRHRAVSEIHVDHAELPATVYVNYGTLMRMYAASEVTAEDIILAFVLFTERMLAKASDPRTAKTCQFIDLSAVSFSSGFRTEVLKIIYSVFEPNYPETLYKMVMHPVSTVFVSFLDAL